MNADWKDDRRAIERSGMHDRIYPEVPFIAHLYSICVHLCSSAVSNRPHQLCAVRLPDRGEEGDDFGGVFEAGGGFDAAGDIDGEGVGGADGGGDVVGSQTAGEEDGDAEVAGAAGEVPVERLAR